MATYEYDEGGVMAAYFLITFLALILVPLTISSFTKSSGSNVTDGCQCTPCVEQRKTIGKEGKGSLFTLNLSRRTYFLIGGWGLFAFVGYRASQLKVENKIYNPFEILGIATSTPEKEIKSHFKQLSKQYHPDKVKVTANMTIEAIQERFVEITKAYKALTNEVIKENWIKYNHPDGPQSTSMGIALPPWLVQGKNRIWVLAAYGLVFGGALPALVGRWWFGSRQKTKDGIHAQSAATFFKSVKEESSVEEVIGVLGKAYKWELSASKVKSIQELDTLEEQIKEQLSSKWTEVRRLTKDYDGELHEARRTALVLLYAHLLRLNINSPSLKKQQKEVLLQTPLLLNALLNVSVARTWLLPTLAIMRLHAYFTQALPPTANDRILLTQLPGLSADDLSQVASQAKDIGDVLHALEEKNDPRVPDVKKAISNWGNVELVSANFKVIGERIVTPSSIIYLLVKLRIRPIGTEVKQKKEPTVDEVKKSIQEEDEQDEKFLASRLEADEIADSKNSGVAHAPFWPDIKKPSWWIVLADDKSNRVVVPPVKISDIPYTQEDNDKDYRSYKIQFQGPPNTGLFTWKVYIVSDTFLGAEATKEISLKIEDPPAAEDSPAEDDISDPEEDTLAGQMAAMRGGAVKKSRVEESDDESSTDDDKSERNDSDSDSD